MLTNYRRKISGWLSTKDTRRILANLFSLGVIQGTNFLLPLLVLPYLVNVLGLSKFGLFSFAQAFVFFWMMFTDYGFNLSATREVAFHKGDNEKVSEIVSKTLWAKAALCLLAFAGFMAIVFFVPLFSGEKTLYLLSFTMVLGHCLLPVWYFQGVEEMKFITYTNLLSKTVLTCLIFLFVREPSDYIYVAFFYGMGSIIAGICAILLMVRRFGVKIRLTSIAAVLQELKNGWYVFLSHFSINITSNSNILILGFFSSETIVGYYSIADKAVSIARQGLMIFFQATYPAACKQMIKGHKYLLSFFRKFFVPFSFFIVLVCLGIFLLSDYITLFFAGSVVPEISAAIKWLVIMPVIVCLNLPAFQTLLAYNHQKSFMLIYGIGSLLNILLNLVLAKFFLMSGTITAVIVTEIFITVGLHLILMNRHAEHKLFFQQPRNRAGLL